MATIPFTFPTTGIEIRIQPVSPLLSQKAMQAVAKPLPPKERIENPDGTFREEPNYDHPDYARELEAYEARREVVARNVYISLGAVYTLTDDDRARLEIVRAVMRESGVELEKDDRVAFVAYVAVGSAQDYSEFIRAVTGVSQPTGPKLTNG